MGAAHLINFRLLVWGIVIIPALSQGGLKTGFYSSSCPKAESIVRSTVEAHFNKDPTVTAGLLRLHFHDCFVQVMKNNPNFFLLKYCSAWIYTFHACTGL